MKHTLFSLAALGLLLCALSSCKRTNIYETVKAVAIAEVDTTGFDSHTVQTNAFTAVEADCFADIAYHQTAAGTPPRVVLKAPAEVLDHISVMTDDNVLSLRVDRRYRMPERAVVVVSVYAPFVSSFSLRGGKCLRLGRMKISSPLTLSLDGVGALTSEVLEAHEINVSLNGAGSIDLQGISTQRLSAELDGAGSINLQGRCTDAYLELNGAGHIDVTRLQCAHKAQRAINGVGTISE